MNDSKLPYGQPTDYYATLMSRMYLLQINSNVHVGHLHLLF